MQIAWPLRPLTFPDASSCQQQPKHHLTASRALKPLRSKAATLSEKRHVYRNGGLGV